jgi:ribonuclease HII
MSEIITSDTTNTILTIGIDDATKCPCIGSIFVSGVLADAGTVEQWKQLGVKDSKLIAAKKRNSLAKIIKQTAQAYVIMEITPAMIDDNSFNLNDWEMLIVLSIVKKLTKKVMPEKIYVDNWETTEKGFRRRLKTLLSGAMKKKLREKKFVLTRKKLFSLPYVPEHRADENYTIVGAASILSKSSSDAQYRKFKRQYGDFGSGSPGDPKTRLFVWQHRHNPVPIIRTSWNTFKTLVNLNSIDEDPLKLKKAILQDTINDPIEQLDLENDAADLLDQNVNKMNEPT